MRYWCFIFMIIGGILVTKECPSKCTCSADKNVDCSDEVIEDNEIEKILSEVSNETISLNLNHNYLTMLKSNMFSKFFHLERLYIKNNDIMNIEQNAFKGLEKLEMLYLTSNLIENINGTPFYNLTNLKRLYLRSNKLKRVPTHLFSNLQSLEKLSLFDNGIQVLEDNSFENCNITNVYLRGNNISRLAAEFSNASYIENLFLSENPLECSCETYFDFRSVLFIVQKLQGECQNRTESITQFIEDDPDNCTMCSMKPCKNNGVCFATNETKFNCQCKKPYFGKLCELKDHCFSNQCLNNATCINDHVNKDYNCTCHGKYTGKNCSDVKPCYNNPCLNNGQCIERRNASFICMCAKGFQGKICEHILEHKNQNDGLSVKIIALIVVLVIVAIVVAVVGVVYWKRRRNKQSRSDGAALFEKKTTFS